MPRQARLGFPGALHHIMVRGINKSTIFEDDQGRELFLDRFRIGGALAKIIDQECRRANVSPPELKGGGRRRTVSMLRVKIAERGLDELGRWPRLHAMLA